MISDENGLMNGMKRINVLCATRDPRGMAALRRRMDDRYLFRTVSSGRAALTSAMNQTPDVLIVDAVLPALDGIGLIERLQGLLGERMPEVIGGSVLSFSDEAFRRLGIARRVSVPWNPAQLSMMLDEVAWEIDTQVDWLRMQRGYERAREMLRAMGMSDRLSGFTYLAWSSALVCDNEDRLRAVGERVYTPVAEHLQTTPQSVERLIRHAVERTTDTVGAQAVYSFFGNTIDPMRGKPTNAQIIGMLGERLRIS